MFEGVFPTPPSPTIKGMFVNSHIEALREKLGEEGVQKLRERTGKQLHFKSFEAVPVCDEVEILETSVDLCRGGLRGKDRALAAGRLHFSNFVQTPLGRTLMHSMPHTKEGFKTLVHNAPSVARIVFSGTTFRVEGKVHLAVLIENCDYPLEHFCGFFEEWLDFWKLEGSSVRVEVLGPKCYCYRLTL